MNFIIPLFFSRKLKFHYVTRKIFQKNEDE